MGFTVPEVLGNVVGEGDYAGLEAKVRVRPLPLGYVLDLQEAISSDDAQQMRDAFTRFGDAVLISWNVEDSDGEAVPATGEGVLTQDPGLIKAVMQEWQAAVMRPPPQTNGAHANG